MRQRQIKFEQLYPCNKQSDVWQGNSTLQCYESYLKT